jgi:hypothetical protein
MMDDKLKKSKFQWKKGDINEGNYKEILRSLDLLKRTPYPPYYPSVELIKGDILVTAEKFIKENPHLLISMLYIDVDLYAPTKKALEVFLPRMPKGSLIAFDELNHPKWPGETLAFLEKFDIKKAPICRGLFFALYVHCFFFHPFISTPSLNHMFFTVIRRPY